MSLDHTTVNSQITDAVAAANQALAANADAAALAQDSSAAQLALAIALQDAVDHLRNTETLATAATARALAQIADGVRVEESRDLLQEARGSVSAAVENLISVLTATTSMGGTVPEAKAGEGTKT